MTAGAQRPRRGAAAAETEAGAAAQGEGGSGEAASGDGTQAGSRGRADAAAARRRPGRALARREAPVPTLWEVVPGDERDLERVAARCRAKVRRSAALAAGVSVVPVPGLDWATDIALLVRLLPQINTEFGLSPAQIEQLAPDRRVVVYKTISAAGGMLVGKVITRDLVVHVLKLVGVRLTTQQASKFVPLAGQAVSAALTFGAMNYVCEQHIQQCLSVVRSLRLPAPQAATTVSGR